VSLEGKRIGFVGGGNMGEALIRGLLGTKTVPAALLSATDVRTERTAQLAKQFGITAHGDNLRLVRETDVVVLAVKPQIMATVVAEIAPAVTVRHLLISIAAGVSTAAIGAALGKEARIVRVMPNTPALVLQGAAAVAKGRGQEAEDLAVAEAIFGAVGRVVVLDESLMDAVTGLSGSGPAYVALADGGVNMGLDRATALTLATQTVLGAAQLLVETGMHPAVLKDMVSSPGGTTIAGITALEDGGLRATLIRAVERATVRSRELGRGSAR